MTRLFGHENCVRWKKDLFLVYSLLCILNFIAFTCIFYFYVFFSSLEEGLLPRGQAKWELRITKQDRVSWWSLWGCVHWSGMDKNLVRFKWVEGKLNGDHENRVLCWKEHWKLSLLLTQPFLTLSAWTSHLPLWSPVIQFLRWGM